ncbi:MAG TPA: Rieske 2Fe-2S domain-containing protein, partial [Novosphingobium sp.]
MAPGSYLRDCWYVAGWAADLAAQPWQRTFLDEPVALFRDATDTARAIEGRCPHRFAALGHGRLNDHGLACPYHGLVFDGHGRCVHNPHQDGALPAAQLRSY